MTMTYQEVVGMITPQATDIPGLKYFPNLEPGVSNDQDHPVLVFKTIPELPTSIHKAPLQAIEFKLTVVRV